MLPPGRPQKQLLSANRGPVSLFPDLKKEKKIPTACLNGQRRMRHSTRPTGLGEQVPRHAERQPQPIAAGPSVQESLSTPSVYSHQLNVARPVLPLLEKPARATSSNQALASLVLNGATVPMTWSGS